MFEFHHTGILVNNIEDSIDQYSVFFDISRVSEVYTISSQKVRVCFIPNGNQTFLELVEPEKENKVFWKMLERVVNYYHVGYLVDNLDSALARINEKAIFLTRFNSEAFQGRECAFVYNRDMHLIELINRH